MKSMWPLSVPVGLLLLCLAGCSGGTGAPTDGAGGGAAGTPGAGLETPADVTGTGSAAADVVAATELPAHGAAAPSGPVEAVREALRAVQSGQLDVAFDFLPPSYQKDVDELAHTFASKMDAEIWTEFFAVAQKGVSVLREKKPQLLELLETADQPAVSPAVSQNWDGFVDSLELVVTSELSDLEKLKQVSARRFLSTTGNQFFSKLRAIGMGDGPNPIEELSKVEVSLVSLNGESAMLRIQGPNNPEPQPTNFVQVQGRWIPENLATTWEESMREARQQLEQLSPDTLAAQKEQILSSLEAVDAAFEQMLAAKTGEELQAAAFPLMLQGMQLGNMLSRPAGPMNGVTIIVVGELNDDAQTKLLSDLEQLTDDPDRATYTASASGGRTTITLRPVEDPAAFAAKLKFARTKTLDAGARTIQIELDAK